MSTQLQVMKDKLAKMRAEKKNAVAVNSSVLFWGTGHDKAYLPMLKSCVGSTHVIVNTTAISTLTQFTLHCKSKHLTKVFTTSVPLLRLLLKWDKRAAPSLSNYAGSYFNIEGIEIVFINPLKQLATVSYGKFMATRHISKLSNPDNWFKPPEFKWHVIDERNYESALACLKQDNCLLIGIDVETLKDHTRIKCLSYTGLWEDSSEPSGYHTETYVLAIDSMFAVEIMRKFNWDTKAAKVMQNGKYDIAYFARYNAPVYNYQYDTAMMFHSWYAELPKDLGFLNSFLIREAYYWKDLSDTNDLYEYYRYNALDTWGTVMACVVMLAEMPDWAIKNYKDEFPLTFPSHMCELRGIKRDISRMEEAYKQGDSIRAEYQARLDTVLSTPEGSEFNVSSPKQMKQLLFILGCGDLKSADEKSLKKAMDRSPINQRILGYVLNIRKIRKELSTYITVGKEFQEKNKDRILFSINPHGTDTGRQASREHAFWCGVNIQNIPRGGAVKSTYVADEGFALFEVDLEQAESRDTAYLSGDTNLINAVEHSPDFHSANASAFFGIPFEDIFDVKAGKVLNKPLRQLAKPVNHGANYNMGAYVLIDTMGVAHIWLAKELLALNKFFSAVQVAEHLLEQFHKAYPKIRAVFHKGAIKEVLLTGLLRSQAVHHNWTETKTMLENPSIKDKWNSEWEHMYTEAGGAWTRRCFKDPSKSKTAANAYIAHPPQSLNAMTLNKSFITVYKDIAINPKYSDNFKLIAQVHDSIIGQYRLGHSYLMEMVRERMEVPVTIKGYDNIVRSFVVPASVKGGQHTDKGYAKYWAETE
ncbi:MAG: hypothetical protein CMK07_13445 [Ponticaulis sp.]|nr:hypothetical protein [Ponticaulis sp.]|tara:strand:+ start:6944 stop:9385 length:2442 start_codon:yes stop_codon:yes gene_type:complete